MRNESISLALADEGHAEEIVSLIRSGFSPEFLSLTIMNCSGVVEFYKRKLSRRWTSTDSFMAVALTESGPIGCIELRMSADTLFLNYISVLESYRSRGIARQLFDFALKNTRLESHCRMQLEVLEENELARKWYENLGFMPDTTLNWFEVTAEPRQALSAYIAGGPQAEILQAAFGFSQLEIISPSSTYRVGILGEDWIRVYTPTMLMDEDAMGVISTRFPERRYLTIGSKSGLTESIIEEARVCARTIRMSLSLHEYDQRLLNRSNG